MRYRTEEAGSAMQSSGLASYYAARAPEYDQVYARPERQGELAELRRVVQGIFVGRRVLEVACGSGYWTAVYAPVAASVLATDVNPGLVARARRRVGSNERVAFAAADAFVPGIREGQFDACFAGFWWSHLGKSELPRFLTVIHRWLAPGALVMFVDNRFVDGSSTPIARIDAEGNSYQRRSLADGRRFEILKNFPSAAEVLADIDRARGAGAAVTELRHYWYATYIAGPL